MGGGDFRGDEELSKFGDENGESAANTHKSSTSAGEMKDCAVDETDNKDTGEQHTNQETLGEVNLTPNKEKGEGMQEDAMQGGLSFLTAPSLMQKE